MTSPLRFQVLHRINKMSRRFGLTQNVLRVGLPLKESPHQLQEVIEALDEILTTIAQDYHSEDYVRMNIQNELCLRKNYFVPFLKVGELNTAYILKHMERVLQSGEDFLLTGRLTIDFLLVRIPRT